MNEDEKATTEPAEEDEAAGETTEDPSPVAAAPPRPGINWARIAVFGILPVVAVLLAGAAGYLKWQDNSMRAANAARSEAMKAAQETVADMLSYQPDTIDQQLTEARDRLTGDFQKTYTSLTTDVVIPGAKQQRIAAQATVPVVAAVSATADRVVVLAAVNQTVTIGQDPPTHTASSVRVTLDKVGDRWLISEFEPV